MPPKSRMTANPVRPARHRAGKPTGGQSSSDSDSDTETAPPRTIPAPPKPASAGKVISTASLANLDARRRELEKATEERRRAAQQAESFAAEQGFVTEDEDVESEQEEESGSGSDEESEEESSEDEAPRRMMLKPKFVPQSQRNAAKNTDKNEEAARVADEEARQKAADELVEEQIKRDLAARAAGKKHWDDEEPDDSDVDTTDDVDPEAEEAAWRVRELKRLMRTRNAIEEREKELAEVERRRNLTVEERAAEDEAHLTRQREDKESRGKMSYMQRYFHRGAFFQEDAEKAGLLQRDIMGSRFQDDVRNREALPEYLQRRDMAKLGRKGASKYKDMRSEDTGQWGRLEGPRSGRSGMGDDDRFRPDDDGFMRDERGAKGANAIPLGPRRDGGAGKQDSGRHGSDRFRSTRDEAAKDGRSRRQRSRSASAERRDRHEGSGSRRKRSTSRDIRDHEGDKRRRVDADLGG